jgi:hypothetical protein
MKVEFWMTEDDYANAAHFHERRQVLRNALGHHPDHAHPRGDLPAWWLPPDVARIVMVIAILWAILAAVLLYVVVAYRARRMYCQYKAIQEPMTVELVDEGLRLGSRRSDLAMTG